MLPQLMRAGELDLECAVHGANDPDDVLTNFRIWRHGNREVPVLDMHIVAHSEQYPEHIQSRFDIFITAHRDQANQEDRLSFRMQELLSGNNTGRAPAQTFDRRARYLDLQCVVCDAESATDLVRQFRAWRDEPKNSDLLIMGIEINCRAHRIPEENVLLYNAFIIQHSMSRLRPVRS